MSQPITQREESWEEDIQKDLDDGKFGMICSNEQTFKRYIFPRISASFEKGYIEGQKNAFGVDRKAVAKEAVEEYKEGLLKEIGEDETIEEIIKQPNDEAFTARGRNQMRRHLRSLLSHPTQK